MVMKVFSLRSSRSHWLLCPEPLLFSWPCIALEAFAAFSFLNAAIPIPSVWDWDPTECLGVDTNPS